MIYPLISSKDNQYIKLTKSLQQKKFRNQHNLFVAEGLRNCKELLIGLLCHNLIEFVLLDADKSEEAALVEFLKSSTVFHKQNFQILLVDSKIFKSLVNTQESQGIIIVAKQYAFGLEEFSAKVAGGTVAILDGLQDPGNVGTILRTAWGAGLKGVIMVNNSADVFNPKVVRAAMGAVYNLPVIYLTNQVALDFLQGAAYEILVADAKGEDYRSFCLADTQKAAWLLGSEAVGPSEFWRSASTHEVSIPMAVGVDSLNVAVAAGILFFGGKR